MTHAATPQSLAPVFEQERLVTLDVLRGIALLGVVIANVWLWFSGIVFRPPAYREELSQLSLDAIVFNAIFVLVSGKAMSTFSFLFGLGFAIQMLRAQARGRSIVPTYARRLTVLLVIGLAHLTLLWYGDILTAYAAFGFVLLLFRKRGNRTLLIWTAILVLVVPLMVGALPWVLTTAGVQMPEPNVAEVAKRHADTLATFQNGSYQDIVGENLQQASKFYLGRKTLFLLYVLGLFVLGLYVGRRRIFENVTAYRPAFRRIAMWGIPIGLMASTGGVVLQANVEPGTMMARPALILVAMTLFVVGTVPLAAGYVSAVTLLLQHPAWGRHLLLFAPVGRMALTNYLAQTVIMLLIFYPYGGGLIGRTGPTVGLAIALGVFAAQMVWSRVWLTHFRFGPMEWVWRSLTYGVMPPMKVRRADVEVPALRS